MEKLKNKLIEIRREHFIESKKKYFKSIFGNGFIDMILMQNFQYPSINTIISFLESPKRRDINYRVLPSMTISTENNINHRISDDIIDFFEGQIIHMLFSYIFESTEEVSGYISVDKKLLAENFFKLSANSGFILEGNKERFIYFSESKDSKRIYIYKGLILEKKYIKILY